MGLKWSDIDFENHTVSISHSAYKLVGETSKLKDPKNKSSIRVVSIPEYCLELLKSYRISQAEERLAVGDQWHNEDWLFTQWNGKGMNPDTPSRWFPNFLKRHSLPHVKFHALRHSSATLLLYSGANVKAVASRLGHAQLATTNRYLHALKTADKAAAESLDAMFGKHKMGSDK